MQLPEFTRSTTLRWSFLVASMFTAFIVALLGFVCLKTERDLTMRSDGVIASQMGAFADLSPERRLDAQGRRGSPLAQGTAACLANVLMPSAQQCRPPHHCQTVGSHVSVPFRLPMVSHSRVREVRHDDQLAIGDDAIEHLLANGPSLDRVLVKRVDPVRTLQARRRTMQRVGGVEQLIISGGDQERELPGRVTSGIDSMDAGRHLLARLDERDPAGDASELALYHL
jgi:hypothetical protein